MAARQMFTRVIQRMGLTADTPVAVVVTGGNDSLALTLLAKQAFQKVIGITVDHRLNEENALEAKRAGELVRSLGVEHHIVSLKWGGKLHAPPRSFVITEKRHLSMLSFCQRKNIRTLMIAHHLDDQIETFLLRMALRSSLDDMGGRFLSTVGAKFPQVNILRPLLEVRKADLQEACQNEGVKWTEEQLHSNVRKHIRKIVQENEELVPGIAGLIKTCQETRRHLKAQANESLSKINLSVNQEYGYLSFSLGKLLSLPPIVMTKVIQLFAAHIGGARRSLSRNTTFARFHRKVLSRDRKVAVFDNCLAFFPDLDNDTVIIGRAPPKPAEQVWTPISVGQTVHWDKRWRVTLKQLEKLDGQDSDKEVPDRLVHNEEQLYVSHMEMGEYWGEYWGENKQDKRLIPASILPDNKLWSGLPVVCTESGHVVVAPHFKIIDHSYGVDCDVTFDPSLPLIQYLDTNVY